MDYINYVKEYPVQGVTGLWGGVQGALQQAAGGEPVPDGSTFFGDRMLIAGGSTPSSSGGVNTVEYGNITSSAASVDFGDLLNNSKYGMGCASPTRAIWFMGSYPTNVNTIEFFTIATQSNSTDFGDLDQTRGQLGSGGCANATRGLIWGGCTSGGGGAITNNIQYIEIASTSNSTDFGNMAGSTSFVGAMSGS